LQVNNSVRVLAVIIGLFFLVPCMGQSEVYKLRSLDPHQAASMVNQVMGPDVRVVAVNHINAVVISSVSR
jgi:hypothetical protein